MSRVRTVVALLLVLALVAGACTSGGNERELGDGLATPTEPTAVPPTMETPTGTFERNPAANGQSTPPVVVEAPDVDLDALFDSDDPVVDAEFSAVAEPPAVPGVGDAVIWAVDPVTAPPDIAAHVFVPTELLDGRAAESPSAILWNQEVEEWILLPASSVDGGIVFWTPHFSVFGFFDPVVDLVGWVVEAGDWLIDKTSAGIRAVASFVWQVGRAVTDPILEGLAQLDTALGGVANGPPSCEASSIGIAFFDLASETDNDDDKILHCWWTDSERDRLHLRVTNNRPYGFTAIFDSSIGEASILEWPNTDLVGADRILNRGFEAIEDRIGQTYIPSGATTEIVWDAEGLKELNIRFEATIANAAIDPGLAVLLAFLLAPGTGGSVGTVVNGLSAFDCTSGFVEEVLRASDADGVFGAIEPAAGAFKNGVDCFAQVFGESVRTVLSAGFELIRLVRNTLSVLADSVVEGNSKVKISLRFERATSPAEIPLTSQGIGPVAFGSDFDEALAYITSLLGEPEQIRRAEGGACDEIGGCELLATWAGFAIAGPHDSNTVDFWMVETSPTMSRVFSLPGVHSVEAARDPASWEAELRTGISRTGDWWLVFDELGLSGWTAEKGPPGDWLGRPAPPLPPDVAIEWVYTTADWTESQEPRYYCAPGFTIGTDNVNCYRSLTVGEECNGVVLPAAGIPPRDRVGLSFSDPVCWQPVIES